MFAQAEKIAQICEEIESDVQVADKSPDAGGIFSNSAAIFLHLQRPHRGRAGYHRTPANIGKLLEKVDEVAKKTIPRFPPTAMPATATCIPYPEGSGRTRTAQTGETGNLSETLNLGGVLTGNTVSAIRNKTSIWSRIKAVGLMWGIKKTFDPNNILSPGVGLPPNH